MTAHHLRIAARFEVTTDTDIPFRFAARAGFVVAALVAITALGGILVPATYAQETTYWGIQGLGQDWVDLVLVVPVLVATAAFALRGSRIAALLLGGAVLYAAYSYAIYAFAMHLNWLFLLYCATLGISVFALVDLVARFDAVPRGDLPVRAAAGMLFAIAGVFGLLWLGQAVPAMLRNAPPAEVVKAGLATNPVYVLDLSLVLPALVVIGVSLLRGERFGFVVAPIALGFSVLMAIAIGGMVVAMGMRGFAIDVAPVVFLSAIAAASAVVLFAFLRAARRHGMS